MGEVSAIQTKYGRRPNAPVRKILNWFLFTKGLLLLILLLTPKQYDTSSKVLLAECPSGNLTNWLYCRVVQRLVIWDSVYFTEVARRGLLYEHEWAFGRVWSGLIAIVVRLLWMGSRNGGEVPLHVYGFVSIVLANICHFAACIALFYLTLEIFREKAPSKRAKLANSSALLFTISPGGIFLLAGYSEPLFALLSFTGLYLREKKKLVLSGALFAVSCGIRGNGVLYGIYFLYDLVQAFSDAHVSQIYGSFFGGSLIGLSFIGIQAYAYSMYCIRGSEPLRPWCSSYLPSIYWFVQSEYWNVGFLRYWTLNNIPNFLFGMPTLLLLYKSLPLLICMKLTPYVLVQSVILGGSLFFWHVQIVTRVATCLPAVYWYVALLTSSTTLSRVKLGKRIVSYFVVWIIVQGVLYGAFLPPA